MFALMAPLVLYCVLAAPVQAAPTADISAPSDGSSFRLGDHIGVNFSCSAAPGGPPLASCVGSDGTEASPNWTGYGYLDTDSLGSHDYSVTATDTDGQTGDAGISYTVSRYATSVTATSVTRSATLGDPISYGVWLRVYRQAPGTVTFSVYGPSAGYGCKGDPVFVSRPVRSQAADDPRFISPSFTPKRPGTYHWTGTYSGDADNEPVTSECGGTAAMSTVTRRKAVCRDAGALTLGTFTVDPPLGDARPLPGLRIRVGSRGDVDARIAPSITYAAGNELRTVRLESRIVRVNHSRKLRFKLPARVVEEMRADGSVYGRMVEFHLPASLKTRGSNSRCFGKPRSRSIKLRVTAVSGRVALRRR